MYRPVFDFSKSTGRSWPINVDQRSNDSPSLEIATGPTHVSPKPLNQPVGYIPIYKPNILKKTNRHPHTGIGCLLRRERSIEVVETQQLGHLHVHGVQPAVQDIRTELVGQPQVMQTPHGRGQIE